MAGYYDEKEKRIHLVFNRISRWEKRMVLRKQTASTSFIFRKEDQ